MKSGQRFFSSAKDYNRTNGVQTHMLALDTSFMPRKGSEVSGVCRMHRGSAGCRGKDMARELAHIRLCSSSPAILEQKTWSDSYTGHSFMHTCDNVVSSSSCPSVYYIESFQ